ncbi:HET domain-containing protein [Microdochium nivale]|nr:HET domain-containing protein [Microdochium nivale]
MRLLNTTTITFAEWEVTELPPYAILSHVWGENEVLYHDIINKNTEKEKKKGYEKVTSTCRQARRDGYEWAWIDSCCINKTDGVELSEAINSMYKWYQQAGMCYAFLADVKPMNPLVMEPNPVWQGAAEARRNNPRWRFTDINPSDWEVESEPVTEVAPRWQWTSAGGSGNRSQDAHDFLDALARSIWFTRGWTLQELIAPQQVVFYNASWTEIGTRKSLKEHLTTITGIEVSALLGGVEILRQLPAALKMSWASGRVTTKVEDMAYCLMGMFEIAMPLLYGEGLKAMTRLQELIFLQTEDYSLLICEKDYRDLHAALPLSPQAYHRDLHGTIPEWADSNPGRKASIKIDFRDIYLNPNSVVDLDPPTLSQARGMRVTMPKKKSTNVSQDVSGVGVFFTYWYLRHEYTEYAICLDLNVRASRRDQLHSSRSTARSDEVRQAQHKVADEADTWSRAWYTPILVPSRRMTDFYEQKLYLRTRAIENKRFAVPEESTEPEAVWVLVVHMTNARLPRYLPALCRNVDRPRALLVDLYSEIFRDEPTRVVKNVKAIELDSSSFSRMLQEGMNLRYPMRTGDHNIVGTACIYLPEGYFFKCVTIAIGVVIHQTEEFWCSLGEVLYKYPHQKGQFLSEFLHKSPHQNHLAVELKRWRQDKHLTSRDMTDRLRVVVAKDEVLTIACKSFGYRRVDVFGWIGRLDEGDGSVVDPLQLRKIE